MISPEVVEKLYNVVSDMEKYRYRLMNDYEEIGVYNVAYNVSNYIIEIEKLLAEARFHNDRVSG
jgi:hypothetical protein